MMKSIIAFSVLVSYVVMECLMFGIPKSLSQSWFSIVHKWIFSAVMISAAVLLFLTFMEILPMEWQWLGFICSLGALCIGAAPNLLDDMQHSIHMTGAFLLALASQGIVALLCPSALFVWVVAMPVILLLRKNVAFWVEMIGGALLFYALFLQF